MRAPWNRADRGYRTCAHHGARQHGVTAAVPATEQDILHARSHAPNAHHESPPARPRVTQNLTRTRRQCHLHDNAIACHPSAQQLIAFISSSCLREPSTCRASGAWMISNHLLIASTRPADHSFHALFVCKRDPFNLLCQWDAVWFDMPCQ